MTEDVESARVEALPADAMSLRGLAEKTDVAGSEEHPGSSNRLGRDAKPSRQRQHGPNWSNELAAQRFGGGSQFLQSSAGWRAELHSLPTNVRDQTKYANQFI